LRLAARDRGLVFGRVSRWARWLLVGHPRVRRCRKTSATDTVIRKESSAERGAGCFGSRVTGARLPSCAYAQKTQVNRGPVLPDQARRHAGSCRPATASSLSHGGALRKRHAASARGLRAVGTHRMDRLAPFGVPTQSRARSGASCAWKSTRRAGTRCTATGR